MIKSLGKETFIYGVGQVINAFIGVFALPIITRCFTKNEVGVIDLLFILQSVGMMLSLMGYDTALTFYFWHSKGCKNDQKKYTTTAFYSIFIFSLIVFLFLFVGREFVECYFLKASYGEAYFAAIVGVPFFALFQFINKLCRIHKKPILFNILTFLNVFMYILFVFLLIVQLHLGIEFVYYSRIVGYVIVLVIGVYYFRKDLFHKFSLVMFVKEMKYGVPLMPLLAISFVMKYADRYFILKHSGTEGVGNYAVAVKIALLTSLVLGAFNRAWGPYSMSIKDSVDAKAIYSRVLTYYFFVAFGMVLLVQLLSPYLILLLSTKNYLLVKDWIGILTIGVCLQSMYNIIAVGLNIVEKTYYITFGLMVSVVFTILANIVLVPIWGPVGAALAGVFGYVIAIASIYFISNKFYKIDYDFNKISIIFIVFLGGFICHYVVRLLTNNVILVSVYDLMVLMLYVVVAFKFNIIDGNIIMKLKESFLVRKHAYEVNKKS